MLKRQIQRLIMRGKERNLGRWWIVGEMDRMNARTDDRATWLDWLTGVALGVALALVIICGWLWATGA
jgi:hypothetical protein